MRVNMEKENYLKNGERLDDLQLNGLHIIQNPEKFCFGMDAVLLSSFCAKTIRKKDKVLDLGTGTGIIPILLSAKAEPAHISALEIQDESVDMAKRSVNLNGLDEKIDIIHGDIKTASLNFGAAVFDAVTTNPPYMNDNHGIKNPDIPKAIARHEILCNLDDIARESSKLLKTQGRFYMGHRPFRMTEIICTLAKYKLETKRICMVHPFVSKEPNMLLIEAVKNGKPFVKFEPPIIVYETPGKYTEQLLEIYGLQQHTP